MFVKWHEKKWQKDVNQMETYLKAGENQTLTLRLQQSWLLPAACLILFAKKKKKNYHWHFREMHFSKLKSREVIGCTTSMNARIYIVR